MTTEIIVFLAIFIVLSLVFYVGYRMGYGVAYKKGTIYGMRYQAKSDTKGWCEGIEGQYKEVFGKELDEA